MRKKVSIFWKKSIQLNYTPQKCHFKVCQKWNFLGRKQNLSFFSCKGVHAISYQPPAPLRSLFENFYVKKVVFLKKLCTPSMEFFKNVFFRRECVFRRDGGCGGVCDMTGPVVTFELNKKKKCNIAVVIAFLPQ